MTTLQGSRPRARPGPRCGALLDVIEPIYLLLLALTLAAAMLAAWRPEVVGRRGLLVATALLVLVLLMTGLRLLTSAMG